MRKWLLVFLIVFSMTGCNSKSATEIVISDEPKTDEEIIATETTATENEDNNLSDNDLLMSLNLKRADNLKVVSTVTSDDFEMTMTTYYSGNKTRTEMETAQDSSKIITIMLEDEKVMYNYPEGGESGIKMINISDEDSEEMGLIDSSDGMLDSIKAEGNPGVIARKDTLDGQDVVYIESNSYEEDMTTMIVKMWFSTKYGIPLKYQLISDGEVFMESNSVISDDKIDSSMFEVPANITFTEVDIDSMTQ